MSFSAMVLYVFEGVKNCEFDLIQYLSEQQQNCAAFAVWTNSLC